MVKNELKNPKTRRGEKGIVYKNTRGSGRRSRTTGEKRRTSREGETLPKSLAGQPDKGWKGKGLGNVLWCCRNAVTGVSVPNEISGRAKGGPVLTEKRKKIQEEKTRERDWLPTPKKVKGTPGAQNISCLRAREEGGRGNWELGEKGLN